MKQKKNAAHFKKRQNSRLARLWGLCNHCRNGKRIVQACMKFKITEMRGDINQEQTQDLLPGQKHM